MPVHHPLNVQGQGLPVHDDRAVLRALLRATREVPGAPPPSGASSPSPAEERRHAGSAVAIVYCLCAERVGSAG